VRVVLAAINGYLAFALLVATFPSLWGKKYAHDSRRRNGPG
jgi:hypothetical protein